MQPCRICLLRTAALLAAAGLFTAATARANADELAALVPPTEVPAALAQLPKHELKLDTLTGCGLIDSASSGPGVRLLGLRIGRDSTDQAVAQLKRSDASLRADLGYRGYREDLPVVAITALNDAHGLREGWLRFNPLRVLYRATLIWEGAQARAQAQALLARELPDFAAACSTEQASCVLRRDGVSLELSASAERSVVSLASIPLDEEARETEKLIDADIRRKHVGK